MTIKRYAVLLFTATLAFTSLTVRAENTTRWSWLANSYWYVPTKNLPAYQYNAKNNTLTEVSDQTVFQITNYANGYFWGRVAGQLGDSAPSCLSLVGSVTPEGRVYLTFTPAPFAAGSPVVVGLGQMVEKGGQWTMVNQMSSGPSVLQVGHWAYMIQTKPGQKSWLSLPGIDISVDQFLAQCPDAPTLSH
jgi:hypothetical protein